MMTIEQMANKTKENYAKALNIGYFVIKAFPDLEDRAIELKSNFKEVENFLNSAKVNYIRKSEMRKILERSEEFLQVLMEFEEVQIKTRGYKRPNYF